jgi:hypothetical protein
MPVRTRRLLARLAVVAVAAASLVALAAPTPSGGLVNPGIFDVPAGSTVTFVEPYMTACNDLDWGYQIEGASPVVVDQHRTGCSVSETFPSTTIGPFATDVTLLVFLTDVTCSATYTSDGNPVDHAAVFGNDPPVVAINDAGGGCTTENSASEPSSDGGNLRVGVEITPVLRVSKVVTGDDPGLAFPIEVSCTAEGEVPKDVAASADPEIELPTAGDSDSVTVPLEDGESADIPILTESVSIDLVTCTITESLAAVTLPTGFTCTPTIDHPVVTFDGEWSDWPVTVTNACTQAVEIEPNFTG